MQRVSLALFDPTARRCGIRQKTATPVPVNTQSKMLYEWQELMQLASIATAETTEAEICIRVGAGGLSPGGTFHFHEHHHSVLFSEATKR
jgi:hypothetical protein